MAIQPERYPPYYLCTFLLKNNNRFGAFETLKDFMMDSNGQLSVGGKLLSGLGAGVCEAIVAVTPMETIKVKFVHDQRSANPKFKGFVHGVRTIIQTEGKSLHNFMHTL